MDKFWESIISVYGWLIFSVVIAVILGFVFGVLDIDFWNNLSWGIKIPILLVLGYLFFTPYWDKRVR